MKSKQQPVFQSKMPFQYIRTDDGLYQCPYCDYKKKNQPTVNMHIKAKHSGTYKHKCEHCDYETVSKQNLENHMICKHPQCEEHSQKDMKCPHDKCDYACRTKGQLRSHYLLKHLTKEVESLMIKQEENYICSCCDRSFEHRSGFVYHCVTCLPEDVANNENHILGLAL